MVRIALVEEYGYRLWDWQFLGTAEEFERWFRQLKSVQPFFLNPERGISELGLGVAVEVEEFSESVRFEYTAHFHEEDDSYVQRKAGGRMIVRAGFSGKWRF